MSARNHRLIAEMREEHSANDIARFFEYIEDEEDYYKILNNS